MSHIYWNKKEIPIPSEAYINHNDGRVFVMLDGHRKVIGHAASNTTMYPNEAYRTMYSDQWTQNYGVKDSLPFEVKVGLYMLTLGAASENGIYSINLKLIYLMKIMKLLNLMIMMKLIVFY